MLGRAQLLRVVENRLAPQAQKGPSAGSLAGLVGSSRGRAAPSAPLAPKRPTGMRRETRALLADAPPAPCFNCTGPSSKSAQNALRP